MNKHRLNGESSRFKYTFRTKILWPSRPLERIIPPLTHTQYEWYEKEKKKKQWTKTRRDFTFFRAAKLGRRMDDFKLVFLREFFGCIALEARASRILNFPPKNPPPSPVLSTSIYRGTLGFWIFENNDLKSEFRNDFFRELESIMRQRPVFEIQ